MPVAITLTQVGAVPKAVGAVRVRPAVRVGMTEQSFPRLRASLVLTGAENASTLSHSDKNQAPKFGKYLNLQVNLATSPRKSSSLKALLRGKRLYRTVQPDA